MNGAEMLGACAAKPSTGAQHATTTMAVIHNTDRRQVPGTLRIANDSPKANSTAANHTSQAGSDFGNSATLPGSRPFAISPSIRAKIPNALSPAASKIESDPIAAVATRTWPTGRGWEFCELKMVGFYNRRTRQPANAAQPFLSTG